MAKLIVGFPKCVCNKPFTLVHSVQEFRAYVAKNPNWDHATKTKKQKAKVE